MTGNKWIIPFCGTWIDAEDALALSQIKEEVFCHRVNENIIMNTVFFLDPSEVHLRQLEEKHGKRKIL